MKDIKGFEGLYAVTEDGKVRSYPKQHNRNRQGRFLRLHINPRGYITAQLCKNKIRYIKVVHRLVAEAFIPNPENKPQVNHADGNKTRNIVSNLEWATNKENSTHAFETGICKKPLTSEQVIEIRKLCKIKKYKEVAEQFRIKPATIWDIKHRRHYAEVRP